MRNLSGPRSAAPLSRKWRAIFRIPHTNSYAMNHDLFAGTPYEEDALGTKASFDNTTGQILRDFYRKWYAPNNAILVIAGDVDPDVFAKVKQYYGSIPRHDVRRPRCRCSSRSRPKV